MRGDGRDSLYLTLLEADKEQINAKDANGDTPLHIASSTWEGDVEADIDTLLTAGALVDVPNSDGQTPLAVTARPGCYINVARRLKQILLSPTTPTRHHLITLLSEYSGRNYGARNYLSDIV